jgi:hypothetical protein
VKIPLPAARAVFWRSAFWLAALAVLVLML